VGRTAVLPEELLGGPFTLEDARAAGLDRWHLEGLSWRRIGPETYVWTGLQRDPEHGLRAALRRLPSRRAFSGRTAAWLHAIDATPCDTVEATIPAGTGVSARAGIALRRSALLEGELVSIRGMPVTSITRTIYDLASTLSLTEAVVMADAALHRGKVRLEQLNVWAKANAGRRGIRRLRRVLELAEPAAESPMESRLRMVLVLGGLPRPKAQVSIHDRSGRFVGRPDLYYEKRRLGIEYDGVAHRDAMAQDNRRQNALLRAGVRLLRFTAGDVLGNPTSIVAQVREMLATADSSGFDRAKFPARAGRTGKSYSAAGSVSVNSLPSPGVDFTLTSPP
jgi:very-short-patch-repair endonuclease